MSDHTCAICAYGESQFLEECILSIKKQGLGRISYIQPIALGLSNILIIAASIFILGEHIGLFQWLGIACILGGVLLMNIKG